MGNLRDMKNVAKMGYSSHLDTFATIIATFKVSKNQINCTSTNTEFTA